MVLVAVSKSKIEMLLSMHFFSKTILSEFCWETQTKSYLLCLVTCLGDGALLDPESLYVVLNVKPTRQELT